MKRDDADLGAVLVTALQHDATISVPGGLAERVARAAQQAPRPTFLDALLQVGWRLAAASAITAALGAGAAVRLAPARPAVTAADPLRTWWEGQSTQSPIQDWTAAILAPRPGEAR